MNHVHKKDSPHESKSPIVRAIVESFVTHKECEEYCYDKLFHLRLAKECKSDKEEQIFGSFLMGILHNVLLWVKPPKIEDMIDIQPRKTRIQNVT